MLPKVSIIIPCLNQLNLTKNTIEGIAKTCDVSFEVIVVNNASTDNTKEWLDTIAEYTLKQNPNFVKFIAIHNPINRFWSGACNTGMLHASGKHIAFMANDLICGPGIFSKIIKELESNPKTGAASPWLIEDHVIGAQTNAPDYLLSNIERYNKDSTIIEGWHQAPFQILTREMWNKVGEWDECLRTHCNDNDFGIRIELAGFIPKSFKDLIAYHAGSFGRKSLAKEPKFAKNDARYFHKKWNKHSYEKNDKITKGIRCLAETGNYISGRQKKGIIKWQKTELV